MPTYGLIGHPLAHSWSAKFFAEKFLNENLSDSVFRNFPLRNISDFKTLIREEPDLQGLNVTIPYKEQIVPYLDDLEGAAAETGAVNTIRFERSGAGLKLIGFNTDVIGFEQSLAKEVKKPIMKALILGTGGASKAVGWVLRKRGIRYLKVSRKPSNHEIISYSDLNQQLFRETKLIINTTPLGMAPDIDSCPSLPYHWLESDHILFDLIYNPPQTVFMKRGLEKGCQVINGLGMLTGQALAAWEIWNRRV
ncbi:MAG TPA: shikimate dehydrogenase [Bacteroidales bacterium]|nr:shikimate dehydrogenase [Bacteroidales bacterium]